MPGPSSEAPAPITPANPQDQPQGPTSRMQDVVGRLKANRPGVLGRLFRAHSLRSGHYDKLVEKWGRKGHVDVSKDSREDREVTHVTVPEPHLGIVESLLSLKGLTRRDEANAGRFMSMAVRTYLDVSREARETNDENKRSEALELAKVLVEVNIPTKTNLGEEGKMAVDAAILAAADRVSERVVNWGETYPHFIDGPGVGRTENRAYYNNAPHVIAVNNPDGSLNVTTVYGPAEVTDEGAIIPTNTRSFKRGLIRGTVQSRGPKRPPIEVSTVHIDSQKSATVRTDKPNVMEWHVNAVDVNGSREDKLPPKLRVSEEGSKPAFDTGDLIKIFREVAELDRTDLYSHRGNWEGKDIVIVSQLPNLPQELIARFVDPILSRREEQGIDDDGNPIVVTDIEGYGTHHADGLKIIDASDTIRKVEADPYSDALATVQIEEHVFQETTRQLNTLDYYRLIIEAAQRSIARDADPATARKLSLITPQILRQHPELIAVDKMSAASIDGGRIDENDLNLALHEQDRKVNYLSDPESHLAPKDVKNVDPELLLLVLSHTSTGERTGILSIPDARDLLKELRDPLEIKRGSGDPTARQQIRAKIAVVFGNDVFVDENHRVIAEALLNDVAPREPADFVIDLARLQAELRAAETAVKVDTSALSARERATLSENHKRAESRLKALFDESNIPESARGPLASEMRAEGVASPAEVLSRVANLAELYAGAGEDFDRRVDVGVQMVQASRELDIPLNELRHMVEAGTARGSHRDLSTFMSELRQAGDLEQMRQMAEAEFAGTEGALVQAIIDQASAFASVPESVRVAKAEEARRVQERNDRLTREDAALELERLKIEVERERIAAQLKTADASAEAARIQQQQDREFLATLLAANRATLPNAGLSNAPEEGTIDPMAAGGQTNGTGSGGAVSDANATTVASGGVPDASQGTEALDPADSVLDAADRLANGATPSAPASNEPVASDPSQAGS